MRDAQAWAIVLAVLSVPMSGLWAAIGALLAIGFLLADGVDQRRVERGDR